MKNKSLVLLSYGRISEYKRAIFCILSLWAWGKEHLPDWRILIYTDQPDFFKPYLKGLNVQYVHLTDELTTAMLAGTTYFHRRKVAVIDMTFKMFPGDALMFIDSDTFFITEPAKLLNSFEVGKCFMHKREYMLKDGLALFSSFNQGQYPEAFLKYIAGRSFEIGGLIEQFSDLDYSWNSGVLALDQSFATYMPDVFRLTDEFYANSEWFISEQLAFALVLQKRTEIRSAEEFVLHYWGAQQKVLLDGLLDKLFESTPAAELFNKTQICALTKKWERAVKIDMAVEQINIAYANQNTIYGIKQSVKLVLQMPLYPQVYKSLFKTLKSN
ncbi:hypothetical protein [Pedobacter africanus]|uniref:Nucleotide-diphospho-sugar transferase n=1 Tax=Pedobacter africanus TaxID=151894 RepID=A0A1W2DEU6_9SPHI|nr:hypothetical protein [Pedobacter africanus]SMC96069.1 hypothetical protein SAMN04488524_3733 [Pedobacter africanus]